MVKSGFAANVLRRPAPHIDGKSLPVRNRADAAIKALNWQTQAYGVAIRL
jgi:hypothetical protein